MLLMITSDLFKVQSIIILREMCGSVGGDVGDGGLPGKGGRGRHSDVQHRVLSCLLHKPHHILLLQLSWRIQGAKCCAPSGVTMSSPTRAFKH